jgi:thymidylate synthase (FAD)
MKIIPPDWTFEDIEDGEEILRRLERYGRTCYKSEDKITPESARAFVSMLIKRGHESVLEHEKVTVRIICDRGVTHEIVRHRIASYSQESTRYCNYAGMVTYIQPDFELTREDRLLLVAIEDHYEKRVREGLKPQQARYFLPNGLKTEIVCTFNLREWRHFFRLRTSSAAHPQMREITVPMLAEFKKLIPVVFDDISVPELLR